MANRKIECYHDAETLAEAPEVKSADCLRIHCAGWFAREDFRVWRHTSSVAAWKKGRKLEWEYGDVFLVFDAGNGGTREEDDPAATHWEGDDDSDGLPRDIYLFIGREIAKRGLSYGTVWISA